jgi:23S rRNA maturation mini-RNase III
MHDLIFLLDADGEWLVVGHKLIVPKRSVQGHLKQASSKPQIGIYGSTIMLFNEPTAIATMIVTACSLLVYCRRNLDFRAESVSTLRPRCHSQSKALKDLISVITTHNTSILNRYRAMKAATLNAAANPSVPDTVSFECGLPAGRYLAPQAAQARGGRNSVNRAPLMITET